jgi:hypothetical protein
MTGFAAGMEQSSEWSSDYRDRAMLAAWDCQRSAQGYGKISHAILQCPVFAHRYLALCNGMFFAEQRPK